MLAVTAADGLALANAGNVLRPKTQLLLSAAASRPRCKEGAEPVQGILEKNPPGAKVSYEYGQPADRLALLAAAPWLETSVDAASAKHYSKPAMWMGEGGTIPFMAMLGVKFPRRSSSSPACLGSALNALGRTSSLHIDYAKSCTACVADVLGCTRSAHHGTSAGPGPKSARR